MWRSKFQCIEDKLPFSNAELNNKVKSLPFSTTKLNDKVRSLLMRAKKMFKNSSVIPSHLGAHPLFICINAHRNPFSTTIPPHLSVCGTEIFGVVRFLIKVFFSSSIPSLSIFFLYRL